MNNERKTENSGENTGQFTRSGDGQRSPNSQKYGDHRDHKAPIKEDEPKKPDDKRKDDTQSDEGQPSSR